MLIRLGYDIIIGVRWNTPVIAMLETRPEVAGAFKVPDTLHLEPEIPRHEYLDSFGNRCVRLVVPPGTLRLYTDALIEDDGQPDLVVADAPQHPIEELPAETLQFLLSSRYCEVDKLSNFAWKTFGDTPLGWARVQAVCDYVHRHITFGYPYASPTKTAFDVFQDGKGVCRDFQHLAVTLCRCLGIPARYVTGYIGDIRIPPVPGPMDFSAWFQVYLGGQWYDFDARFNTPRIGRTLQGVGRDATDVAILTTFGPHTLDKFLVIDEEIVEEPKGIDAADGEESLPGSTN